MDGTDRTDGTDGIVIIGHRSFKSTFGANKTFTYLLLFCLISIIISRTFIAQFGLVFFLSSSFEIILVCNQ